jgi:electron transfer flavoprotein beta subunit
MKIIVCIKQVPETNNVSLNKSTGTLNREGVKSIINPEDKNALEMAMELKDKHNGYVTVITMGPPQAKEALIEAYGMGADDVILLSDRAFAGADTLATAYTLFKAVEKIGVFDVILCGRQAIDGDTAQVGPQLAEFLNIPQITYALKSEVKDNKIIVDKETEEGTLKMESSMPCLITVLSKANEPRYPSFKNMGKIFRNEKEIYVWTIKDLNVDPGKIGLEGSPTKVFKAFVPKKDSGNNKVYKGIPKEMATNVVEDIISRKLL